MIFQIPLMVGDGRRELIQARLRLLDISVLEDIIDSQKLGNERLGADSLGS